MNRRTFIQASLFGVGALRSLDTIAAQASTHRNDSFDLAIVKGEDIQQTLTAALDAIGGIGTFVKPGNIVLLKPNMSFPNPPAWGTTTHPEVIRTVVKLCVSAGAKRVIVTEFPMSRPQACFERSGLKELISSLPEMSFVELKEESQFEKVEVASGKEVREIQIAKLIRKADVFINLPTAKAHTSTGVSFGIKNLMGLFWNRWSFHQEHDLHEAIVDLASTMKPHLTILDAAYALLTNGPQGPGKTAQLNTMIAGRDMVAVDALGCELADWNSRSTSVQNISHIMKAAERGLGSIDLSKLNIFRQGM